MAGGIHVTSPTCSLVTLAVFNTMINSLGFEHCCGITGMITQIYKLLLLWLFLTIIYFTSDSEASQTHADQAN